jgi:N-acetylmuramoyl-L-alanine amidase
MVKVREVPHIMRRAPEYDGRLTRRILTLALVVALASGTGARVQDPVSYRVITTDGTSVLAVHASTGTTDIVTLDAAARLFGLLVREDARAGGVVVVSGSDRVILTAGQSTVSSGGRLVSLSAPVTKTGATWLVPVDFLRTLNRGIDVRRPSRLIVVAPAVVPRVTPRVERTATGARLVLSIDPPATTRVTRDGAIVSIRFQANGVDVAPLADAPADYVASLRSDGPALLLDLGSAVTNVRGDDGRDPARVTIELFGAPQASAPVAPPPVAPLDRAPGIRTIAIDPGHGGDEVGARSVDGTLEKDVTMAVAQRVKALLEARLGVRVIFTRDGDVTATADRRAALANNNKADLFISLHANSSPVATVRGAQVLSLDADDYANVEGAAPRSDAPALPVAVVGGGTRVIDAMPWQLAQLPHASASASLATIMAQRLAGAGVTMHTTPVDMSPLRVLVGANMPAILIELGMLTNAEDAALLATAPHLVILADAIVSAIADVRFGIPQAPAGGGRP